MAIRAYVSESIVYRTAGMIDAQPGGRAPDDAAEALKRIEEYDVECSMVKVWCSEMLDYVVDETVQIYGGAGYVEDYPAERYWRDARVNRIFEGTNEINRLLVPGRLIRRAMKGELPIFQKAMALMDELTAGPAAPAAEDDGFLAAEARMVRGRQEGRPHVPGPRRPEVRPASSRTQQEVLGLFADVAMETYALESALLRAQKRAARRARRRRALQEAAVRCFAQDALDRIEVAARRLLAALDEGDMLRTYLAALKRFTKRETLNTIALRRQVAEAAIEQGGYPLGLRPVARYPAREGLCLLRPICFGPGCARAGRLRGMLDRSHPAGALCPSGGSACWGSRSGSKRRRVPASRRKVADQTIGRSRVVQRPADADDVGGRRRSCVTIIIRVIHAAASSKEENRNTPRGTRAESPRRNAAVRASPS